MSSVHLSIADLSDRHFGLTQPIADYLYEAASVCLNRHHISPTDVAIQNDKTLDYAQVSWKTVDKRMLGAWNNEIDTTRDGACACAIAAVELVTGLLTVRRAETLTGSDYYVSDSEAYTDDLEDLQRLEVSGVDKGTGSVIFYRLQEKVNQTKRGRSNLPAIACVVGFEAARIVMQFVKL